LIERVAEAKWPLKPAHDALIGWRLKAFSGI
jgi:hypothetical protein